MELKRIDVLSCAKVIGVLYAMMGLLVGAFISLLAVAGAAISTADGGMEGAVGGALFGVGAVIILPLFYGVMGAIFVAIGAALYNLVAGWVGGIRFELS